MKVLKFGGSSVANAENINKVVDILTEYHSTGQSFAVIFSAFGGVTDMLLKAASLAEQGDSEYLQIMQDIQDRHTETVDQLFQDTSASDVIQEVKAGLSELSNLLSGIKLLKEASLRSMDYVVSFGERMSSFIIAHYLKSKNIKADYLDARKVIVTDDQFGAASVDMKATDEKIKNHFSSPSIRVQVITGFIASSAAGITTTLGRGGSDFTAAIFAHCLEASALEIWTDVSGVLTCDPRKVTKAYTIDQLSYSEAMEMSHFGAKVIYPPTIQPALVKQIPIFIKNTFRPSDSGTKITHESAPVSDSQKIKGLSAISDIALLNLEGSDLIGTPGMAARLFSILADNKINIILIIQASSEHSISFALKQADAIKAKNCLESAFSENISRGTIKPLHVESNLSIIAVIGENMKNIPGISGKLFSSLGRNNINVVAIAQGSSELNISFIIKNKDENKTLNLIHDSFFLSDTKTISLFVIGTGNIGSTLMKQITSQHHFLKTERKIDLRLVGVSNSKKMAFDAQGIAIADWENSLSNSETVADVARFVKQMKEMNLANAIFIDNTANKHIPSFYTEVLSAGIPITTPNKIASSSSLADYISLKQLARAKNTFFMYETNVGAGLPVISTLQNLIESGDKIIEIKAVLSGTLSYIFNKYDGSSTFAALVKQAQEGGYTEPDPRDDLSGQDVLRKATILARECGMMIEKEEIVLSPILSDKALQASTVDEFYKVLSSEDKNYTGLVDKAIKADKKLRFIASINKEHISAALEEVSSDSPFYHLSGTDNMIVFRTERYDANPLVIKGPGAGADVTAAGIFSEIIQIAYRL